ncbi:unnamed protein product [Prunus armeniaca]|uniref:Uncharacterized protein n=1 Tax=Prunus armeniaca TaxID=36596 RepID=A0A6J5TTB4_PRUAR|nr:unnamed protein product [Prunus armeniaca]
MSFDHSFGESTQPLGPYQVVSPDAPMVFTWDNNLVQIMDAWMSSPQSSQGSPLLSVAADLSGPANLTHLSFRRNDAVLHMELVASVAVINLIKMELDRVRVSSSFANCARIVASQLRGACGVGLITLLKQRIDVAKAKKLVCSIKKSGRERSAEKSISGCIGAPVTFSSPEGTITCRCKAARATPM